MKETISGSSLTGMGEYGATVVRAEANGDLVRLVFGRKGPGDSEIFFSAVFVSHQVARDLAAQIGDIG
ncbi:MAG: hypothetical protein VYD87_04430 [Pseudomonadota bacterium]|nr:hypothetical protein [Pseudomonadota bacterium]